MNQQILLVASLSLAAISLLIFFCVLIYRFSNIKKMHAKVDEVVKNKASNYSELSSRKILSFGATDEFDENSEFKNYLNDEWLNGGIGKALVAEEDRRLLEQAGLSVSKGPRTYLISRIFCSIIFPLLVVSLLDLPGYKLGLGIFFAFAIGLMLPKWVISIKAGKRRRQVEEELPMFVDLLRLLQGVGLSVDQSLHILANDFKSVLYVLSGEIELANRLYATGRGREQSLQRLTSLSADDDMASVVNILVQVDKHGGAVQEPLAQFAMRLREKRQAAFKEKIGAITVKMTGVMVVTLLPALIVITAGPGFMAVIRSLSKMGGG